MCRGIQTFFFLMWFVVCCPIFPFFDTLLFRRIFLGHTRKGGNNVMREIRVILNGPSNQKGK